MTPRKVLDVEAEGAERVIAGDGGPILDLPAVVIGPATISRWTPSDEERAAIAAGSDILLMQLNYGQPLQPLCPVGLRAGVALDRASLVFVVGNLLDPIETPPA